MDRVDDPLLRKEEAIRNMNKNHWLKSFNDWLKHSASSVDDVEAPSVPKSKSRQLSVHGRLLADLSTIDDTIKSLRGYFAVLLR